MSTKNLKIKRKYTQKCRKTSPFIYAYQLFLQLKHHLQWEGNVRDLSVLSKTTSFDVRKESGLSLKSAFRHILSVDLRDDIIFPSTGSLFQMTSEIAGAGSNVGYLKNDFVLQGNYSILEDYVSISFKRVSVYLFLYNRILNNPML